MPIISAHDLKKEFVERLLFDGVSFEIGEKDRVGLVGVNGCGKTTLFRILLGEEGYDAGELFRAKNARIMSMTQTIADTNQTVYDETLEAFRPLMDAEEELKRVDAELASAEGERLNTLIKRQHALREEYEFNGGMTYRSRTRSALMGLGFTEEELTKRLGDMSGGQRNKAQLAKVLLSGAQLLLLDEPTSSLDPRNQYESMELIRHCAHGHHIAVLVVIHDLNLALRFCDRFLFLKDGTVYASGGREAVTSENIRAVYGMDAAVEQFDGIPMVIPHFHAHSSPY